MSSKAELAGEESVDKNGKKSRNCATVRLS